MRKERPSTAERVFEPEISRCFHATYENAMAVINDLKAKFGESTLFGNEKDQSFHSSIGQIYQTWDGIGLYPSVEEKAAMLLYLVVKNHSFSDGNKRIASAMPGKITSLSDMYYDFNDLNGFLMHSHGSPR